MPGWVRFTPPLPTKLGQISTDVDMYADLALENSAIKDVLNRKS